MASVPLGDRAAARKAAYGKGLALPPASKGVPPGYPIQDAAHWDKARQAVGRVKDPARRAALARLLRKTAPQFGRTRALKQSWAAPAGSSHAGDGTGVDLAVRAMLDNGQMLTCPECGHVASPVNFGASGAPVQKQPAQLRTRQRADTAGRAGFEPGSSGVNMKSKPAAHALAGETLGGISLAAGIGGRRYPVQGPPDVGVRRGPDGTAVLYHRRGGADIAQIRKNGDGTWTAVVNGQDGRPHTHQRTALMEAVGTYNNAVSAAVRPAPAPLQPAPQQTGLMRQYGIPAIRALATPAASASAGPRMTSSAGTADDGGDQLGPAGKAVYRKLRGKGMEAGRALVLARRAEQMKTARAA